MQELVTACVVKKESAEVIHNIFFLLSCRDHLFVAQVTAKDLQMLVDEKVSFWFGAEKRISCRRWTITSS